MKKLLAFMKKSINYIIAFLNNDYKLNLTFSWKNSRSTASHTTVLYHKQVCAVGTTNVWTGPFTAVLVYLINHQRHRAHARLRSKLKTNNTLIRSDRGSSTEDEKSCSRHFSLALASSYIILSKKPQYQLITTLAFF